MTDTPDLDDAEVIEILKGIIRGTGNNAARIAAIKELRAIRETSKTPAEGSGLYDVDNPGRIRKKAA